MIPFKLSDYKCKFTDPIRCPRWNVDIITDYYSFVHCGLLQMVLSRYIILVYTKKLVYTLVGWPQFRKEFAILDHFW